MNGCCSFYHHYRRTYREKDQSIGLAVKTLQMFKMKMKMETTTRMTTANYDDVAICIYIQPNRQPNVCVQQSKGIGRCLLDKCTILSK